MKAVLPILVALAAWPASARLLQQDDPPTETPGPSPGPTPDPCYGYDIYTLAGDRLEGYNVTDSGAVANLPFYNKDTDDQLGSIQFAQFNLPGECYLTTGIFSFANTTDQLAYSFTTCHGRGTSDIITGGSGSFVGAYGTNSYVSNAPDFSRFDFSLKFCVPPADSIDVVR